MCGINFDYVLCGGDKEVNQHCEQWTDGTNALVVAPGQFILYDRNDHTIAEIQKREHDVVYAQDVTGPFSPGKKVVM